MNRTLQHQREAILLIAKKYGARNVRVFGSMSRGDDSNHSDVDLLVDLEPGRSLLDQVGLKQDIEELLGRPVDIVVEGGISPYLEERILSEAVPL
jgi:predicted nucleotidyltransferase